MGPLPAWRIAVSRNGGVASENCCRVPNWPLNRKRSTVSVLLTHLVGIVRFCSSRWMSEGEEFKRRQRRSSQEIQRLVAEFRTSGLRRSEFCRIHGLTHDTLKRGLKRERINCGSQGEFKKAGGGRGDRRLRVLLRVLSRYV